jgi:hypothetical protein
MKIHLLFQNILVEASSRDGIISLTSLERKVKVKKSELILLLEHWNVCLFIWSVFSL